VLRNAFFATDALQPMPGVFTFDASSCSTAVGGAAAKVADISEPGPKADLGQVDSIACAAGCLTDSTAVGARVWREVGPCSNTCSHWQAPLRPGHAPAPLLDSHPACVATAATMRRLAERQRAPRWRKAVKIAMASK